MEHTPDRIVGIDTHTHTPDTHTPEIPHLAPLVALPAAPAALTLEQSLWVAIRELHARPELEEVYSRLRAVLCRLHYYQPEVAEELVQPGDYAGGDVLVELVRSAARR